MFETGIPDFFAELERAAEHQLYGSKFPPPRRSVACLDNSRTGLTVGAAWAGGVGATGWHPSRAALTSPPDVAFLPFLRSLPRRRLFCRVVFCSHAFQATARWAITDFEINLGSFLFLLRLRMPRSTSRDCGLPIRPALFPSGWYESQSGWDVCEEDVVGLRFTKRM